MIPFSQVGGQANVGGWRDTVCVWVVRCTNQKEEMVLTLALEAVAVQLEGPPRVFQQGTVSPQRDEVTPVALCCFVVTPNYLPCITGFGDVRTVSQAFGLPSCIDSNWASWISNWRVNYSLLRPSVMAVYINKANRAWLSSASAYYPSPCQLYH